MAMHDVEFLIYIFSLLHSFSTQLLSLFYRSVISLWNEFSVYISSCLDFLQFIGLRIQCFQHHALFRYKLLVVTKSSVDVIGMQEATMKPSCYFMGGKKNGGRSWYDSKIVLVTHGLLLRWYANWGAKAFRDYDGVFFDGIDEMETNPEYALLWQVAVKVSCRPVLRISGVSGGGSENFLRETRSGWNALIGLTLLSVIELRCVRLHRCFLLWCT